MRDITRIGMDTSKSVFQLHGVDAAEQPVLRKKLRRRDMLAFFERLAPMKVGMEACGGTHYWARELRALGHEVKLLPPQYAKAYVKRGKNDAADAEALCEAMSRPIMRFVPAKTAEHQAAQMLAGTRDRLIRRRTQLTNAIRGYAAAFGLIAARGVDKIEPLLARLLQQVRRGKACPRQGTAGHPSPWLVELLKRKPPKLAAVALANKMARIAWKLMVSGQHYNPAHGIATAIAKAA